MRRTLSLTFLAYSSCFNPDLSKVTIVCPSGLSSDCPAGQVCQQGTCSVAADLSASLADLAGDLAGGKDGPAALAGCKQGGARAVGAKARACPGAFPTGGAAGQCSDGAVPCATYASVDAAACGALAGFFVADVPAYFFGSQSNETCGTSVANQMLYGCGTAGRAGVQRCMGFLRAIDLGAGFASSNGTLAQLGNQDPANGVLCCLP